MTKRDFIEKYAAKTGSSKKAAGEQTEAFLEILKETLSSGEKVQFVNFGTFEIKDAAARTGRNPKTGETVEIPAKKSVKFRAGKKLKI